MTISSIEAFDCRFETFTAMTGQQDEMRRLRSLSASVIHDLRNPLAAIQLSAELLSDVELPLAQRRKLACSIHSASKRVEDLIQELRYLSVGMEESFSPCNLSGLVYKAYDGIAGSAASKRILVKINVPKELMLFAQRTRMERVFTNLMNNSVEAVPEGGLLAIDATKETNNVFLRIDDNGPGIPETILPDLFLPFVGSGKLNGSGMGLTFCRRTVRDHGGDLWVGPKPERGARFIMQVPAI